MSCHHWGSHFTLLIPDVVQVESTLTERELLSDIMRNAMCESRAWRDLMLRATRVEGRMRPGLGWVADRLELWLRGKQLVPGSDNANLVVAIPQSIGVAELQEPTNSWTPLGGYTVIDASLMRTWHLLKYRIRRPYDSF